MAQTSSNVTPLGGSCDAALVSSMTPPLNGFFLKYTLSLKKWQRQPGSLASYIYDGSKPGFCFNLGKNFWGYKGRRNAHFTR
jgi:hypothetical protein